MSRTPKKMPANAKKVFTGEIFDVWQWEQTMFDGSKAIFEKLARPDTVQIVAVTPENKIIVTYEEQPGKPPFISIPGGRVDDGEDNLAAAKRELLEETGLAAKTWELFLTDNPVSKMEWSIYTYIAKECIKTKGATLDAGEKIEVKELDFDSFVNLIDEPTFHVGELKNILKIARYNESEKLKLKKLLFN